MPFKFERLEVWRAAVAYVDQAYAVAQQLPKDEDFNLRSQLRRAATSIALNIAEGSMGQPDAEQARFVGYAIRSTIETVACLHLIRRRAYLADESELDQMYRSAEALTRQLYALRQQLDPERRWVREDEELYHA